MQNSPNPLLNFPGDYYKLDGGPDISVSVERSYVYQNQNTSLFLTLENRGRISSIKVNEAPSANAPEEIYAARMELDLEKAKTAAQDISVSLKVPYPSDQRPLEVKREVSYAGTLREGQISPRLEFPVEVYENVTPGEYIIDAVVSYTYQKDVAAKPESSRPQNPDIFYLYDSASQTIPLKLTIERRSGVKFQVLETIPTSLEVGSKDNIVKIIIKNIGNDTARDLVARLKPESGIYVSADQSPIPTLHPGERAELIYKLDVSKDSIPDKRYMLKLLFEFTDSYRKGLTDSENVYLMVKSGSYSSILIPAILAAAIIVAIIAVRRKISKG